MYNSRGKRWWALFPTHHQAATSTNTVLLMRKYLWPQTNGTFSLFWKNEMAKENNQLYLGTGYKKAQPSATGLGYFVFLILMKINKNGIKLWKEHHLLDDEVVNEKYGRWYYCYSKETKKYKAAHCRILNMRVICRKKWWNVMHKTLNYKTKMTKVLEKKHVNLIGDKYNLASKNWVDEMIVMVMTKLKGKNPMTKKWNLKKIEITKKTKGKAARLWGIL